jgi:hypothetical protein
LGNSAALVGGYLGGFRKNGLAVVDADRFTGHGSGSLRLQASQNVACGPVFFVAGPAF